MSRIRGCVQILLSSYRLPTFLHSTCVLYIVLFRSTVASPAHFALLAGVPSRVVQILAYYHPLHLTHRRSAVWVFCRFLDVKEEQPVVRAKPMAASKNAMLFGGFEDHPALPYTQAKDEEDGWRPRLPL